MRRTDASTRDSGTAPEVTSAFSPATTCGYGPATLTRSIPAPSAVSTSLCTSGPSCSAPPPSVITIPSNPSSPSSTSVIQCALAVIFVPCHELYETITTCAPAATAAANGGRCTRRISASSTTTLPWSMPPDTPVPHRVPPAPT